MHTTPSDNTKKTGTKISSAKVNVYLLTKQVSGMDISIPGYQQVTIKEHQPGCVIVNAHIYDKPIQVKATFGDKDSGFPSIERSTCLAIMYSEDWKTPYYRGCYTKDIIGVLEILKNGDLE
jgi:hypothetical protein